MNKSRISVIVSIVREMQTMQTMFAGGRYSGLRKTFHSNTAHMFRKYDFELLTPQK